MLQFHYAVLSKHGCDSSTDQAGRASVGRPIATGHLQDTVGLGNEWWGKNNKRFPLFISFNFWCRDTTNPISTEDHCYA